MRSILTSTERTLPAYRLPGLSRRAATFVVEVAVQHFPDWDRPTGRPRALSVVHALRLTLCRRRRNATYQDLPDDVGVGTTTVWAYHQQLVALLADVLDAGDPAELSVLVTGRVCLSDGTLVPTVHGRHRSDLASGKHRRYGVTVAAAGRSPWPAHHRQSSLSGGLA